jgi:rubredoxin
MSYRERFGVMAKPQVNEETTSCPKCGADWIDRKNDVNGEYPYKRQIAIIDREKDRCVEWECPDCKTRFSR